MEFSRARVNMGNAVEDVKGYPQREDVPTLYAGEVELMIAPPVNVKMVSSLYNGLNTIPEIRVLHTRGTIARGTVITIVLDKPVPLIKLLSTRLPDTGITLEIPESIAQTIGKSGPRSATKKEAVIKILLTSNKPPTPQ
ncbi:MAG: hypothetical protein JW856_01720 [Dehalococcoidales bacterium]|nr:hypothetical protein [Dehalococcoidales bacterium]